MLCDLEEQGYLLSFTESGAIHKLHYTTLVFATAAVAFTYVK